MILFKIEGRAKEDENWIAYDQPRKVADEINYLGIMLERRGGWNRQKTKTIRKGSQALLNTDNA
jgi:hypothetical protein